MRVFSLALSLLALIYVTLMPNPLLALDGAAGSKPPSSLSSTVPASIAIAPHRATYTMALASVKNGTNITGVTGKLVFEWNDVCDGWAVQQHLQLHFNYSEGEDQDISSSEISWESKDGKKYNFNIHHDSNGKETEYYRGKAQLSSSGGKVIYSVPKGKVTELPAGTMFPSAHTTLILEKAAAGEKLFSRHVFDGTDADGSSDVSAFISPPLAHKHDVDLDPKLQAAPILNQTSWPVRLAFFKNNTETGEPDYEMDLSLLANGVASKMHIDYGDFAVTGTLSDIQALPRPGC